VRTPLLAGIGACVLAVVVAAPAAAASSRNISATVAEPGGGSMAVTYDTTAVPTGAQLSVKITQDTGAVVALEVDGLLPDHDYAAHAHVEPCGATGADAGPHFQGTVDPAAGPDATADNEVHLVLHTDAAGDGQAETEVPFVFAANRSPGSIVVHDGGHDGPRVGCLTLRSS
jgi:Cu-Zn family superoxide dismutase